MTDIDVWPYTLALTSPWTTGRGRTSMRRGFLVQVGRSFGDAAPIPGAPATELQTIRQQLLRPRTTGRRQPHGAARHALLEAGLAERAREAAKPLGALLGEPLARAPRPEVTVNATIPLLPTPQTIARAKAFVREGYRTLKLKVGPSEREPGRVAEVREAVGAKAMIRLDANGTWTPTIARARLEALEPLDIQYVEQPLSPGQRKRFLELAARSPVPLAPDEDAHSLTEVEALLDPGILEFFVLKPMMLGGPDLALAAVTRVEDAGATPILTDVVESGVGRGAALHVAALTKDADAAHGLASGTYLKRDLVEPPLVPRNGMLRTPTRPGLGVNVRRPGR